MVVLEEKPKWQYSVRQDISDDLLRYMQEFYVGEFRKEKEGFLYSLESGDCYRITVEKMQQK